MCSTIPTTNYRPEILDKRSPFYYIINIFKLTCRTGPRGQRRHFLSTHVNTCDMHFFLAKPFYRLSSALPRSRFKDTRSIL